MMAILTGPAGASAVMLALVCLFTLFQVQRGRETPTPLPPPMTPEGWYSLYFTVPQSDSGASLRGGPDSHLAEALDAAETSVDVATYDLNLWSVRDALLRAHEREVQVRVIVDSDNILGAEVEALTAEGIPVLGDRREPLMHHKFVVIDHEEVWTGSMNLTISDAYFNDNNLLRIAAEALAQDYTREFEEMFLEDRFGALSRADTPYPTVEVDGTRLDVYFSPDDGVASALVGLIAEASRSIRFMAYAFTSQDIAEAMLDRARMGVEVQGVLEGSQLGAGDTPYSRLKQAGLDVRLDANPRNMHHKVIILDEAIVITGSYNFSRSAELRNDENLLVLHDPEIAAQYQTEFERVFEMALR